MKIHSFGRWLYFAGFVVACLLIDTAASHAQIKQRVWRDQTEAAELLEAMPDVKPALNTELFKELKANLPQMKLGGLIYYFVEGDRRVTEEQLLLYAAELNQQYVSWRALQSIPAALRPRIVAQRESELVSEMEAGKVVRWKKGAPITYCVMRNSFGSGQQATQRYGLVVNELKAATQAWTSIPNSSVPEFIHRSELDNSPLTSTPDGVTFAVWSINLPGSVIASAFFPNDPQEDWNVLIDPQAYFGPGLQFDRVGVLRHELGHVLGFRHEHPRSEAPLVCQTLEVFDDDVVPLGEYDPLSVMHYFCRGFNNPEQQELNIERRQLKITELDRQGVRLIYPPEGQTSGFQFAEFDPVREVSQDADRSRPMSLADAIMPERAARGWADRTLAQDVAEQPWVEPQDSTAAINEPDLYAWRLFVALNWPADLDRRVADENRNFGENETAVWEAWKFSSGANDEVFLATGEDPGPWITTRPDADIRPARLLQRRARDFEQLPLQQLQGRHHGAQDFDPALAAGGLNENHLNKDAYEFIRQEELYNIEGQEKLFEEARQVFAQARAEGREVQAHEFKVHFPVGAKEVKAQWRPISIDDKARYRWVEFDDNGTKLLYGLTALHITTKDVPNWFWATFEHVDNPLRENAELWEMPSVDASAGTNGYPEGLGIEGTRWENYRLRGTQLEFFDTFGNPTILANSQIESGFQLTSSCITCHARAAIGRRREGQDGANRPSIFKSLLPQTDGSFIRVGNIGALPEELFVRKRFGDGVTGELEYLQLDFVWSLMRARRKNAGPPPNEVSFQQHIRPLFRPLDVDSMRSAFDLTEHEDVSQHADAIYERLKDGSMPCDAPWNAQNIALFKKWIDGGKRE